MNSCVSKPSLRMTKRTVSPSRTCSAFNEKALSVATISTVRVTLAASPGLPPLMAWPGPCADAGMAIASAHTPTTKRRNNMIISVSEKGNCVDAVQTRGGGGSWCGDRPVRSRPAETGKVLASANNSMTTAGDSKPVACAMNRQQGPAACLALPLSGQGGGGQSAQCCETDAMALA